MDPARTLEDFLKDDGFYAEAEKIVLDNCCGEIYLVGGYVFRPLAFEGELKGFKPRCDIDFLIGSMKKDYELPPGWTSSLNLFGSTEFIRCDGLIGHIHRALPSRVKRLMKIPKKIDLIVMSEYIEVVRLGLPPTLETYLKTVPFDIQSIAYDARQGKLIGEAGLKAIDDRTVRVNNRGSAEYVCEHIHGISIEEWMERLARSIGFDYVI